MSLLPKFATRPLLQGRGGGRGGGDAPRGELQMQLEMTGKERREYTEWKRERDQIDQSRLQRQRTAEGDWRREWDQQKDEQLYVPVCNAGFSKC